MSTSKEPNPWDGGEGSLGIGKEDTLVLEGIIASEAKGDYCYSLFFIPLSIVLFIKVILKKLLPRDTHLAQSIEKLNN